MKIALGKQDMAKAMGSKEKVYGRLVAWKVEQVLDDQKKPVEGQFNLIVSLEESKLIAGKIVKTRRDGLIMRRFGVRYDSKNWGDEMAWRESRIDLMEVLMPGSQLLKAKVKPNWVSTYEVDYQGLVKLKHIVRLSTKNEAVVMTKMNPKEKDIKINDDACYKGQILISAVDWDRNIAPVIKEHVHEAHVDGKGCPMQTQVVMLRTEDPAQKKEFFADLKESQKDWLRKAIAYELTKAWQDAHTPPVSKFHEKCAKAPLDSAIVKHLFNSSFKAYVEGPTDSGALGDWGDDYTIGFNDCVDDGAGEEVKSNDPIAIGMSIAINGNGYKGCAFRSPEVPAGQIWMSSDCLKVEGGMKGNFISVLIGTHNRKVMRFNRKTLDILLARWDNGDLDGDTIRVRKSARRKPGQNDNKGAANRTPMSHEWSYAGITIHWMDGGISYPNPGALIWNASIPELEESMKNRPEAKKIKFDFGAERREALGDMFDHISESWNSAKVGVVNNTLQAATMFVHDRKQQVKEFTKQDLRDLGNLQELVVDVIDIEYEVLCDFLAKAQVIAGNRDKDIKGIIPLAMAEKYPFSEVIVTDTEVDDARAFHDEQVKYLKLKFKDGLSTPAIDVTGIVPSKAAIAWCDMFNASYLKHKKDMAIKIEAAKQEKLDGAVDMDDKYEPKMDRSLFLKKHVRGFIIHVTGKDPMDDGFVLTDEDRLKLDQMAREVEAHMSNGHRSKVKWVIEGFSDNKTAKGKYDWKQTDDIGDFRVVGRFIL